MSEYTPECGCRIAGPDDDWKHKIVFCPLHAAAPEMRKALEEYAKHENWICARCGKTDSLNCYMSKWVGPCHITDDLEGGQAWDLACAALAKATAR